MGRAAELGAEANDRLEAFLRRWPRARNTITTERVSNDDTPSRLYEIRVDEWVLFDEQAFPDSPRRTIAGIPVTSRSRTFALREPNCSQSNVAN